MPFDLSAPVAAALALALLGAAFVRGYSGFGFSAIFIACAALVTDPVPMIPVVFACEMLMTVFQARGIRNHIDWRRIFAMLLGAAAVLPVAVGTILSVGPDTARLVISAVIGAMALLMLSGWTPRRRIGAPGHVVVGAVSGAANAAGVGGLPVAAILSAQGLPAAAFRATMIVYLTGLDLLTLPLMWAGGAVTADTARAAALAFPILGLGVWLGGRKFVAASPEGFRRMVISLLMLLSCLGILRALF